MRIAARIPTAWVAVTCALLPAVILSWPLLAMPGIPAFNHDWSWPPDAITAWGAFQNSVHPFSDGNFGALNYYLGSAPSTFIVFVIVAAFGSAAGVKVLVFALLAAASGAAFVLARRIGATALGAAACALAYGASPVAANELAAGHIAYLFAYAGLPIVAWCALDIAQRPRLLAIAILIPVCTLAVAQPQFAVFNAVVLLAWLPMASSRACAFALAGAALLALVASPFEIAAAVAGHPLSGLRADLTTLHWEAANSAPLLQSFLGAGYSPRYDQAGPAALLWLRVAGAAVMWIAATFVVLRRKRWLAFWGMTLLAAFIVAGVNGPLAVPLTALFANVPQAAFFRELYHFSALVTLGIFVLAATARASWRVAAVAIAAVLFVLPQTTGFYFDRVRSYDAAGMHTVAQIIERDPGDGRVLFWPLLQPMGPSSKHAGADPDAFPIGNHASISEFVPVQPLSQIGFLLCDPHTDVRTFLAQFGIRYVVIRPKWVSAYFSGIEPALRGLASKAPAGDCGTNRLMRSLPLAFRGTTHALAVVPSPKPLVSTSFASPLYRLPVTSAFDPGRSSVDPRSSWVDATRWQWWNRAFLGPINPGIITLNPRTYKLRPVTHLRTVILNKGQGFTFAPIAPGARGVRVTGPTVLAGIAAASAAPAHVRACARMVVSHDTYRFSASGCDAIKVEVLALRGSGWTMSDNRGQTVAGLPGAWDEKWQVAAKHAPLTLQRRLPFAIQAGLAAQYVEWTASCIALAAALALAVLRVLALQPNTKTKVKDARCTD